jgi:hypothetical protein
MAAKSPNYPVVDLGTALSEIRAALEKENRNKMSRLVLAKHLGYNSLNGRSLGRIGAVRAYGLVEGSGDDLKISDDAVDALRAPANSPERKAALERLATRPPLFKELRGDFPDSLPSEDNIQYWLAKKGFTGKGAGKAAKSYLTTMRLVAENPADYNPSSDADDEEEDGMQTEVATTPRPTTRVAPSEAKLSSGTPLRVVMNGDRLDIHASVDLAGLKKLKEMLTKFESILEMMEPEKKEAAH